MQERDPGPFAKRVQQLRERKQMTQEELGRAVDYKGGAGVSISRVENGHVVPSKGRIEKLAKVLGEDPVGLLNLAEGNAKAAALDSAAALRARSARLQGELQACIEEVDAAWTGYKRAGDLADSEFVSAFLAVATRLPGAPVVSGPPRALGADADARTEAAFGQTLVSRAVKEAVASTVADTRARAVTSRAETFRTFTDQLVRASQLEGDSPAVTISVLNLAAAVGKTARMVRRGAAGGAGTALLAAGAASPLVALTGFLTYTTLRFVNRGRDERQVQADHLRNLEESVQALQPDTDELLRHLNLATAILSYISVHGAHALSRWSERLGPETSSWESLSDEDKARYAEFLYIAGAAYAVRAIDFNGFLASDDRERAAQVADATLLDVDAQVRARV